MTDQPRTGAARGRAPLSIVILRESGREPISITLPAAVIPGAWLSLLPMAALVVWCGWQLHGFFGFEGHRVHGRALVAQERRWSPFDIIGVTKTRKTMAELKRHAALHHALKLHLGGHKAASQLLAGFVTPEWIEDAGKGVTPTNVLKWPVPEGWFVRGFGSGEGGYHLAVDIMGERGAEVRAAAPGVVGYSGSSVKGYGNLVMLIHPGGWVTAYAHNQRNRVIAGQRVKQGQLIAELGNTGISKGPHVHFEFIHHGKNCDPLPLFRPGTRHRSGEVNLVLPVVWDPRQKHPPPEVRCSKRRKHPRARSHGDDA